MKERINRGGIIMARPKSLTEVVVALSTRIKLDTTKRLDDFCVKNRNNKDLTKGNLY